MGMLTIGLLVLLNLAVLGGLVFVSKSKLLLLLSKYQNDTREFERRVSEQLHAAELKLGQLSKLDRLDTIHSSIGDLNSLLKLPHLRGGFGEAALERLLADFLPVGAYELQYAVTPGSAERVDAVVKYARQILPIDSKFPREQVLPLFESSDEEELEAARAKLSDYIKTQAKQIAMKYIRPEHGTTDMALLFLPSETLYFEVIRNGELFEHLSKLKVYPISPGTLSIALHSVAMAQEYYEMAKGVEKTMEDLRRSRRHFEHFSRRFEEIGKGLSRAQEAFDAGAVHLRNYETATHGVRERAQAEPLSEPEIITDARRATKTPEDQGAAFLD